jgi:hypothetical protein
LTTLLSALSGLRRLLAGLLISATLTALLATLAALLATWIVLLSHLIPPRYCCVTHMATRADRVRSNLQSSSVFLI